MVQHNQIILKCRCDCGKVKDVVHYAVRGGKTKSCGCQQFARKLKDGEAAFNKMVDNMKRSARSRGHAWELSTYEIKELVDNNCFYCDLPPSNVGKPPVCSKGNYVYR